MVLSCGMSLTWFTTPCLPLSFTEMDLPKLRAHTDLVSHGLKLGRPTSVRIYMMLCRQQQQQQQHHHHHRRNVNTTYLVMHRLFVSI